MSQVSKPVLVHDVAHKLCAMAVMCCDVVEECWNSMRNAAYNVCFVLVQDVAQELCAMATMCCDSVKEGLHSIQPISLLDVRLGFTMQRDTLHRLLKLVHKIASGITTSNGPALGQALGRAALEVVLAGFDATARLQEAVLCPEALTGNLGTAWYLVGCRAIRIHCKRIDPVVFQNEQEHIEA